MIVFLNRLMKIFTKDWHIVNEKLSSQSSCLFQCAMSYYYELTRLRSTVEMLDLVNHRYSLCRLMIMMQNMPHCKYGSARKEKQAEQQQRCNKDMIRELQDQKGQLLEENNQLRGENDQLVEVQGQDLKKMEDNLQDQENNKDMIRELQDQKNQLLEENNQLRGQNDQLMEVQGLDLKNMEEKLQNLLESYGERSKYIHSWSK